MTRDQHKLWGRTVHPTSVPSSYLSFQSSWWGPSPTEKASLWLLPSTWLSSHGDKFHRAVYSLGDDVSHLFWSTTFLNHCLQTVWFIMLLFINCSSHGTWHTFLSLQSFFVYIMWIEMSAWPPQNQFSMGWHPDRSLLVCRMVHGSRLFWSSSKDARMPGLPEDIPILSPTRPYKKILISSSTGAEENRVQACISQGCSTSVTSRWPPLLWAI